MNLTTLHDYRLQYPGSGKFPTLTQSGLIRVMLERQRVKVARAAARRERIHRILSAIAHPFRTLHIDFGGKPAGQRPGSLRTA